MPSGHPGPYDDHTMNVESTPAPAPPAMSRFSPPNYQLVGSPHWGHLMPAFLTAPRQLGHMPPATY